MTRKRIQKEKPQQVPCRTTGRVVGKQETLLLCESLPMIRLYKFPDRPRPMISHGCLLIPVAFGVWWMYFRRKASKVFKKFLVQNSEEPPPTSEAQDDDGEDEFASWEEVNDHNVEDPSVRFVRWIKLGNKSFSSQRAHVRSVSRRTLKLASSPKVVDMATPILKNSMDDDSNSSVSLRWTSSGIQWHCLQDVDRMELCSVMSPGSSSGQKSPGSPVSSVLV